MTDSSASDSVKGKHFSLDEDLLHGSGFLYRFVNKRMPKSLLRFLGVSDIVQSVVIRVARNRDQFQGSAIEQYRGWVLGIARNRIVDGIRKYRDSLASSELHDSGVVDSKARSPAETLQETEQADLLLDGIQELPSDLQQILLLRYTQSMTFPNIAAELKIPVTTCRRKWLEACDILRQRLSPSSSDSL